MQIRDLKKKLNRLKSMFWASRVLRSIAPKLIATESSKNRENWKTTWGHLTDILERKKVLQLRQVCEKFV